MPEQAPVYVRFVSSVSGRLVSRWGSTGLFFGARASSPAEVAAGAEPVSWDEAVIPLTDDYCRRYSREIDQALAMGDLRERSRADFEAQEKAHEQRRAARKKRREAEAKAKGAGGAAPTPADQTAPSAPANADAAGVPAEGNTK